MKVKIKIIKSNGKCLSGLKVGDEFFIEDWKTPRGICCSAFNSLWPFARTLLVTEDKKHECSIICPDGILEYKLELVKK